MSQSIVVLSVYVYNNLHPGDNTAGCVWRYEHINNEYSVSLPSAGLLMSAHGCWPQNLLAIINTQHGTVWPRLRAAHLCSMFCSMFYICRLFYCMQYTSPVVVGVPARHLHHVATQDRQPRPGSSSCNRNTRYNIPL